MSGAPNADQEVLLRAIDLAISKLSEARSEAGYDPMLLAIKVGHAVRNLEEELVRHLLVYATSETSDITEYAYRRYVRDVALLKLRVAQIEQVVLDRPRFEKAMEEWLELTNLLDSALEPLIDLMTFSDPSQAVADLSQGYSFDSENVGFKRVRFKAS